MEDFTLQGANVRLEPLRGEHAVGLLATANACQHTDARNQRPRAAIERIGGTFEGILRAHPWRQILRPGIQRVIRSWQRNGRV
jgi:hypothetical protein